MNLITDPWLPVRSRSGARRRIRPAQIVEMLNGDCAVEPDWPRPDFTVATYELLIGLLSLARPPRTSEEWEAGWRAPPSVEALDAALAPLAHAFALDGEGPRFLQELGTLEGEMVPIEALLIDAAGANAQKKNTDLLSHRGRYPALSPASAAMALYCLQAFAPPGGAGNRTSMRGGGPMTTLVIPGAEADRPASLWRRVWAHVDVGAPLAPADLPKGLPWLAPTLNSGKLHQADPRAHPLQAFFGMPRRIRLIFQPEKTRCALTDEACANVATHFVQRPSGVDYGIWMHPLTPYRRQKEGDEPYSAKPKPGRLGPGDWVSAAVTRESQLRLPAEAVRRARRDRSHFIAGGRRPQLLLAGWAMNNMEAQEYLFAETPLHIAADPEIAADLDSFAVRLTEASDLAQGLLRGALRSALFDGLDAVATDKGVFPTARAALFDRITPIFHQILGELSASPETSAFDARCDAAPYEWLRVLEGAALAIFDRHAPILLHDPAKSEPIVRAHASLRGALRGYGKRGQALFLALGVAPPERRTKEVV